MVMLKYIILLPIFHFNKISVYFVPFCETKIKILKIFSNTQGY